MFVQIKCSLREEECIASEERGVTERGVAMTPGAPEGSGSDGYLTQQSAGPAGVGSQTGSVDSGEWCVM